MSEFHTLKVKEVVRETSDCVALIFDIDESKRDIFSFTPGQYLTLKAEIKGEEVRRAYSICTANFEDGLGVAIKKVDGGKMSTFINDNVKAGDVLEVMPPEGKFTLVANVGSQRDHFFFAAGSGITPVMSMVKSMLENEPKSTAYLLYGSKNEDNIIFKNQLDELSEKYEGQLVIDYTLSKPAKEKAGGFLGLLGKKDTKWSGLKGRIDSEKVARFVQGNPAKSSDAEYYICGPGDMIDTVRTTLMGNGVKKENIHQEYFTASSDAKADVSDSVSGARLKATLNGQTIEIGVPDGKTVLDALLEAGHEAPYSCTSGACSTCMAKVTKGSVKMEACFALDDEEVEQGYVLTCQSHPTSQEVEIDYEA